MGKGQTSVGIEFVVRGGGNRKEPPAPTVKGCASHGHKAGKHASAVELGCWHQALAGCCLVRRPALLVLAARLLAIRVAAAAAGAGAASASGLAAVATSVLAAALLLGKEEEGGKVGG